MKMLNIGDMFTYILYPCPLEDIEVEERVLGYACGGTITGRDLEAPEDTKFDSRDEPLLYGYRRCTGYGDDCLNRYSFVDDECVWGDVYQGDGMLW